MPHNRVNRENVLQDISNIGVGFHKNNTNEQSIETTFKIERKEKIVGKKSSKHGPVKMFQKFIDNGPSVNQPIVSEQNRKTLAVKPFQCGSSRFPKIKQETTPGPGTYNHDIRCNRKIQFYCSFGGPQTLRTSIKVICKNDLKDMCTNCLSEPIGDYYKNSKSKSLCRPCYDIFKKNLPEKEHKRLFSQFFKVRDCSDIHYHEATNAKLRLKSEKDIKKIKLKEAYLSLYYD